MGGSAHPTRAPRRGRGWLALLPACALLLAAQGGGHQVVVEWAPDGAVLILSNQLLARFDFQENSEQLLADAVRGFALSPDGTGLALARGARLDLHDYPALTFRRGLVPPSAPPASDPLSALAFSPDGRTLAAGTEAGHLLLWELPGGELWADLEVDPPGVVERLRFSAGGERLLVAFLDGRAVLWDLERRAMVHRFDWSADAGEAPAVDTSYVDLSPDGRRVLANRVRAGDSKIVLFDDQGRVRWSQEGYAAEFTPDGSAVLALAPPFRIAVLYPVGGETRARRVFEPPDTVETLFLVRLSPDQQRLLGVGQDDRGQILVLWDFQTGWILETQR